MRFSCFSFMKQSTVTLTVAYNSGYTDAVTLEQDFMGTLPAIPTITAELEDKTVDSGILGTNDPYILVQVEEYRPDTGTWYGLRTVKIDSKYKANGNKSLEATLPELAIANYYLGYKYRYRFDNHLKNSSGTGSTAIIKFTFRPGRL